MTQALGPVQTPLAPTGSTVYAIVFQRSTGKVRDVVAGAWDTFTDADWGDYDTALTEKGTASAIYQGDEPSGLDLSAEAYDVKFYRRVGGSPAIGDTLLGAQCIGAENGNVTAISGDRTAADNLETAFDGGSYNVGGGGVVAASVTGAVGSVTGAVGSVTGNVGGNVTGSVGSVVGAVGSVTGAVGSVTGNVGGNVTGSVGSVLGEINATSGTIKTLDALDTAQDTQHSTTQSSLTTVLARLGAWTGTGVNTILGAFKALLNKAASTPSDIGGTFDPAADSTEAIRDRGDAAWSTATSVTVSDKTGFKLASDGLDLVTSWTVGITGNITGNLSGSVGSVSGAVGSVTGNVGGNVSGSVGSVVGAVGSVTGNVGGNVTGSVGSVLGGIGTTGGTITTLDALDTAQDSQHSTTQSAISSAITSILAKVLAYFRLSLRSDSAIATDHATELGEINENVSSGAGDYANTTEAQEAIRDRGDAAWGTATGFATPANVTDARDAILTQGNSAWATATGFAVPGDEMDLVDAPNATAIAAIQSGLSVFDAGSDTVTVGANNDKTGYALTTAYDVYHADVKLNVDEANTQDEYTITWFKNGVRVTSGITVPTIQVVKRSDGTDLIASTTPTQIGSTGSYKHDATTTARMTAGQDALVIVGATIDGSARTFATLVGRDSSA